MTEKQIRKARIEVHTELYSICLSSRYAFDESCESIECLEQTLKESKKSRAKFKKLAIKHEDKYEELTGKKANYHNTKFRNVR